jgi:hypothetical protein
MFIDDHTQPGARVTTLRALRHVLIFQLKLAADAFRDFLLSPLSIAAFLIDSVRQPRVEDSLYLRLMLIGRRSDRMINLFDDHRDSGEFTIDRAVDELEDILRPAFETGEGAASDAPGPEAKDRDPDGAARD